MKKLTFNKIILITLICAFLIITCIFAVPHLSDNFEKTVEVFDSNGNTAARVSVSDDGFEISAQDDCREYIEIAVEEAVDLYSEMLNIPNDKKYNEFFKNVSKINTYLMPEYASKIKDSIATAAIKDDTPFASVITSKNGNILAVYSSEDSEGNNYSQKKTYAGSTIKPLSVYAPLIDSGKATCSTVFEDSPIKKIANSEGRYIDWPSNASGDYSRRSITVTEGIHKSLNTIAVRGLQNLSVSESVSFLEENFGINLEYEKEAMKKAGEEEVLGNIALGYLNEGVSPVDMAGYYQIFVNDGKYSYPCSVLSIETDDGNNYTHKQTVRKVISPVTASIMCEILKGVVSREGTAHEAFVEDVELAGKSGTSDGYEDNWFVGFTSEYICSVWHGYNDLQKNSASKVFSEIISELPASDSGFSLHEDVVRNLYCKKTGQLKGRFCEKTGKGIYNERYIPVRCTECE